MTPERGGAGQSRWLFPLSLVTAVALLVSWFPLGTLLHQRAALSQVRGQIAAVQSQEAALAQQRRAVSSSTQAILRARQQYQLVEPGQSLVQVLPGSAGTATPGSGDPGNQPLVAPAVAGVVGLGEVTTRAPATSGRAPGFFSRLVRILEFWR